MKFILTTPALLLSSAAHTLAWGTLGHETVAFIAQNFVAADTKVFFSSILNDYGTEYLAKVATWADSFRYTQAGQFSAPFHFIDAGDNPPDSCGVKYSRDCGKSGCVVGAINNYVSFWSEGSFGVGMRLMRWPDEPAAGFFVGCGDYKYGCQGMNFQIFDYVEFYTDS
jgi:hypothetical protein